MTGPSLTERLAERLARPVPRWARDRARLHLLDWLGCVAGGRRDFSGRADSFPPALAAAALGNVLEMDDVHRGALLHPGPVIWASVVGTEPRAFGGALRAAVLGYEAMISVGLGFDMHHYAHWHPTSTAGVFGAAAVHIDLECSGAPDPFELETAMGHAGSVAGGVWQTRHEPGNATKQFHIATAITIGRLAATYVVAGTNAPRYILEGEQGLFAATCRHPRPERMFGGPDDWRIAEVSFKPYAACRHAHPAIDAALALPPGALAAGEVVVETYPDALAFCDQPEPGTDLEAKFSLQHCVALVAARGRAPGLDDFGAEARADPAVTAARARVRVASDPAIAARYPDHFGARVRAGGHTAEVQDALGDPERPMTPAQIEAKARALIAYGGLNQREADLAVELALGLPEEDSGTELRQMVERWLS